MSWFFWRRRPAETRDKPDIEKLQALGEFERLLELYDGPDQKVATRAGQALRAMTIRIPMRVVRKHDDLASDGTRLWVVRGVDERGRQVVFDCSADEAGGVEAGQTYEACGSLVRTVRTITGATQIELRSTRQE